VNSPGYGPQLRRLNDPNPTTSTITGTLTDDEGATLTADGGSSSLLDEQALDYVRRRAEEVEFAEGDAILRQGETFAAFWVILRGEIKIVLRSADGEEIRAEHIFGGFDGERPIGLDFGRFWLVRWLVDGGGLGISRLVVAVGFIAVAAVCLVATGSAAARTANGAVWMLWEPVVFGLFLLVGSLWCTVCPLSSGGRAVERAFSLGRPPPPWILRVGTWLSAAGLVLILWSEEFFDMAATPFATGIMLLALMASAVVCCVIWQREVWCRHLSPLGRLGVALSPVAPLTVAARRSICASTCTTHDIPFFESLVVVSQPGAWWARWPGPAVTTMSLLRVAWVVFAAALSATLLWNATGVARKSGVAIRTTGWTLLIVVCTVYTFGAPLLVAG